MLNLKIKMRLIACILLLASTLFPPDLAFAEKAEPLRYDFSQVTAADLISAMNVLRTSYGLQPLIEDPTINTVAQNTAQYMADNLLSWHIGDVAGRLAAAGYGGGSKVWATENFAIGYDASIDEIMVMWSDESHMLPAVKPYYCNIGAGTAQASNGSTYYVLQAAYVSGQECGTYTSPGGPVMAAGASASLYQLPLQRRMLQARLCMSFNLDNLSGLLPSHIKQQLKKSCVGTTYLKERCCK